MKVPWIDIARHAYFAGFRGQALATAVALTLPESGRESTAANLSDPNSGSFGLWQINGVHDLAATGVYPDKVPSPEWIERMYDPQENAKAAYGVYIRSGGSFLPWTTFKNWKHLELRLSAHDAAVISLDGRARVAALEATVANRNEQIKQAAVDLALAEQMILAGVGASRILQAENETFRQKLQSIEQLAKT